MHKVIDIDNVYEEIQKAWRKIMEKTIKERAESFAKGYKNKDLSYGLYTGYIVGAESQRIYDENLRTKKREAMTAAEYNRECAFLDWCFDNSKGGITHSEVIEWARKEVIKEAASWFGDYLTELRDSVNWFYGSSKMKSGRDRFIEAMNK